MGVFRPQASLPLRIARTVLVPYAPILVAIVIVSAVRMDRPVARMFLLIATLWVLGAIILVPALLARGSESSPGQSDDDSGGGGSGPPAPPRRGPGGGGIPLPDAE